MTFVYPHGGIGLCALRTARYSVHTACMVYLFNRIKFENIHFIFRNSFALAHNSQQTGILYTRADELDCVRLFNAPHTEVSVVFLIKFIHSQWRAISYTFERVERSWILISTTIHSWVSEIVMHSRCSRTPKINSCSKIISSIDNGDIEFHLKNWFSKWKRRGTIDIASVCTLSFVLDVLHHYVNSKAHVVIG